MKRGAQTAFCVTPERLLENEEGGRRGEEGGEDEERHLQWRPLYLTRRLNASEEELSATLDSGFTRPCFIWEADPCVIVSLLEKGWLMSFSRRPPNTHTRTHTHSGGALGVPRLLSW